MRDDGGAPIWWAGRCWRTPGSDRAIEIFPVDLRMAQEAAEAFRRFGRRMHPAALNYGDCFAYALAKSLNAPPALQGQRFRPHRHRPSTSLGGLVEAGDGAGESAGREPLIHNTL